MTEGRIPIKWLDSARSPINLPLETRLARFEGEPTPIQPPHVTEGLPDLSLFFLILIRFGHKIEKVDIDDPDPLATITIEKLQKARSGSRVFLVI